MIRKFFALVLLVITVGCGTSATATPAPTLTALPTIPPTGTPIPSRLFNVTDNLSILNYEAVLQLGGAKIGGTFAVKGLTIKATPDTTGKYNLDVDIRFDGNSVTGANDLVVSALKSNLEVDKYPYGRFLATSKMAIALGETPVDVVLDGTLELHGVQRPFTLPVTITVTKAQLVAQGTTSLDLTDFKVNVPTAIMKSQISFTAKITAEETP
jgi:polyisoprenoid-binding protein YceI